jgi:hypothetical protein
MEALTLRGLILFVIVMLAPLAAFVWALVDLRQPPSVLKALMKIAIGLAIVMLASSTSSIEALFRLLGIIAALLGIMDLAVRRRQRE